MNLAQVEAGFAELCEGIELCHKSHLINPALILIYSTIDIAGDLNSDKNEVKARFTKWCDNYLLNTKPLPCSSLELYGARCGILHSLSAQSDLSVAGKVRRIIYAWGNSDPASLQELTVLGRMETEWLALKLEDLIEGLDKGLKLFFQFLENEPLKASRVCVKAEKHLYSIEKERVEAVLKLAKPLLHP